MKSLSRCHLESKQHHDRALSQSCLAGSSSAPLAGSRAGGSCYPRTPPVSVGAARGTRTRGAAGLVVCAAAIAGWARPTEHLRGASRRRQRWRTREADERWGQDCAGGVGCSSGTRRRGGTRMPGASRRSAAAAAGAARTSHRAAATISGVRLFCCQSARQMQDRHLVPGKAVTRKLTRPAAWTRRLRHWIRSIVEDRH